MSKVQIEMSSTHVSRFSDNLKGISDFMYNLVTKIHQAGATTLSPFVVTIASAVVEGMDKDKLLNNFIENSYYRQCMHTTTVDTKIDKCPKKAYFNVPTIKRAEYCHDHQQPGMINYFPEDKDVNEVLKQPYHWNKIHQKDEKFMEENAFTIFTIVPPENTQEFKNIFTKKDEAGMLIVNQEDREIIWEYLFSFVKISIREIHHKRRGYIVKHPDGKIKLNYHHRHLTDIDIKHHADKWGIYKKLEWEKE